MKKLLFFIILCSLFSCSTETQEEQPVVTGKNFALSLYSTDSIYQSGIDSLFLFYFPESSTPAKPIYFQQELAWGDPIVLQDLEPEPHTFITVACSGSLEELKDLHMELHRNCIRINRHDNVSENLFGGVLKADPVSGEKKFELQRLVGGVKINITNFDSLNIQGYPSCHITNSPACICLGDYEDEPVYYDEYIRTDNSWYYVFPTYGVVKGMIEIDYLDENGINKIRMFEFTGKHAIEANKKLELNFMLRKKAITKSGAEDWQLTLEEEVSVL